jgi:hypothetical protein
LPPEGNLHVGAGDAEAAQVQLEEQLADEERDAASQQRETPAQRRAPRGRFDVGHQNRNAGDHERADHHRATEGNVAVQPLHTIEDAGRDQDGSHQYQRAGSSHPRCLRGPGPVPPGPGCDRESREERERE